MVTKTKLVSPFVPPALRRCLPAPAVPDASATQRTAAQYLAKLSASREDCASHLRAVDGILVNAEKEPK